MNAVDSASTAYCVHCIHGFELFTPKKMSPPYTTIPLHPLRTASTAYCVHCVLCPLHTESTASTSLTFLYQRQCPHHHIPLFHCVHCVLLQLRTVSTAYCLYCMLCPLCTVSTLYCIHCIHWFDLFAQKTMSPPPYTTIPLHPLHTVTTTPLHPLCTASTGLTFLYQRQCPHHHITLFHFIHCVHGVLHSLHPLV